MAMKAVVIYEAGGPEVLKVEERPIPKAKPGWVLIRIKAFGLNRSELFTRRGDSPNVKFPRILGIEATGIVEDAPSGEFEKGTVVATAMGDMGRAFDGGYVQRSLTLFHGVISDLVVQAEYTTVPAKQVQPLHTTLPWATLGACAEMFQTAYGSLFRALDLQKTDTLLVRGGTTSIGLAATGLAKNLGCKVIATSRSAGKKDFLLSKGVDDVIVDSGSIAKDVKQLTGGVGVNKVLELVGTTSLLDSLQCVAPGGTVCMTGIVGNSWALPEFSPMEAIPTGVKLTAYSGGPEDFMNTPLQQLVEQIEAGKLEVHVGKTFGIDEIVEAHTVMEANKAGGKVVVLT